ncbi:hypothetical protein [Streptomyces sp. NRRL B-24484]|uniref:hypothetical protein n=1 Tax=Streptomyces sp. NRRL B-24484 TaxID=1463833 RepID=UPI0006942591|nr:hypothetical protein [Streptomyces sp. NRRL B-24484]
MTEDRPHDTAHHRPDAPAGRVPFPRQPDASSPRAEVAGADLPEPSPAGDGFGRWLDRQQVATVSAEWEAVQAGFVDDPADAVRRADALVARAADLVAEAVRRRREGLHTEPGTPAAPDAGTEELRLALRDYRGVLDRLLAS